MKNFILGFLTKTLNKSDEELAELLLTKSDDGKESLKDGALDIALSMYEDKITKIKEDNKIKSKELFDNGYKKAEKEVLSKIENEIRQKYEVEDDLKGLELVDAVVAKHKTTDSKLTPDKIKLTDTYRNREKELTKEMADKLTAKDTEIETLKKGFENREKWSVVSRDIRKKLMEKKPVLPKNAKAAENLIAMFIDGFKDHEWQIDDSGEHVAIKDGKRIEDKFGNEVKFSSLVEGRISDYFDLQVQDPKGSAGNDNKSGGTLEGIPQKFESEEAYNKFLDSTTDKEKREQAYKIWKSQSNKL